MWRCGRARLGTGVHSASDGGPGSVCGAPGESISRNRHDPVYRQVGVPTGEFVDPFDGRRACMIAPFNRDAKRVMTKGCLDDHVDFDLVATIEWGEHGRLPHRRAHRCELFLKKRNQLLKIV
jgi:hypothetical protein